MRALLLAGLAACSPSPAPGEGASVGGGPAARALPEAPPPGAARVRGANYVVDAVPPAGGCATGAPCEVRLDLYALGAFKVNLEYPSKFVPAATPGLTYAPPAKLRGVATALGELPVRFAATTPGAAQVRGDFKLGICDPTRCENEVAAIALDVAVR